jgi:type II secretory pathway predicted ATPase ExeA
LKPTSGPDFARIDATMDRGAGSDGAPARTSEVASQDPGSLTYEPHFGLREKPFSLSSDPRFFYSHSAHGAAFDTLAAGIRRREGILALMGEVGTGKTTLCQAVLQALDRRTFAAFVPDPFLAREDLLKTLLVDFGVISVDEIRNGRLRGASRTDLSYPLYDFLASLQPLKAFAVVMIDEAHSLKTDLLEEIRILSDLEKNREKLLEVVLIGQPELQKRLASPEMRQLAQRVSLRCELVPLVPEEVKAYISHRLTVAGNDGRVKFTEQATECVATASGGIPRVVNLICDRALLKAAWSGTSIVNAEHIVWAATDLQMATSRVTPPVLPPQPPTLVLPSPAGAVEASPAPVDDPPPAPDLETAAPVIDLIRPAEHTAPKPEAASATLPEAVAVKDAVQRLPGRRWLIVTAACVLLAAAAGGWAARHSLAQWLRPQPSIVAPAVEAKATQPDSPLPAVEAKATPPDPLRAAPSRPAPVEPVPVPVATPRVALLMATFQSSARTQQAIEELRDAGYRAYSVELQQQDGERVLAVLVGPYTELAAAERDLDTARQLPDYATARVVQAVPALLPPDTRP